MEKTLELRFRNHENRLVTIRVPNPRADLTATEVATAMDDLMTYAVRKHHHYKRIRTHRIKRRRSHSNLKKGCSSQQQQMAAFIM